MSVCSQLVVEAALTKVRATLLLDCTIGSRQARMEESEFLVVNVQLNFWGLLKPVLSGEEEKCLLTFILVAFSGVFMSNVVR